RKAESGLSASVVGHVRWQLTAILEMAKSDKLTDGNPAEGLVMPRCKAAGEKRTITRESIHRAEMALSIRERLMFHLGTLRVTFGRIASPVDPAFFCAPGGL